MGNIEVCPCMGRDPNEKEIALKENTLMMHKFTSVQIKNVIYLLKKFILPKAFF